MDAKRLILEFLGLSDAPTPVATLVRAAAIWDISANHVRVTLSRLVDAELVTAPQRGLYELGVGATAVQMEAAAWKTAATRAVSPWDGSWWLVYCADLGRVDRSSLRKRERALTLTGFRYIRSGLAARPANLVDGLCGIRKRLTTLGLAPEALTFCATDIEIKAAEVTQLWQPHVLRQQQCKATQALHTSLTRLPALDHKKAAKQCFDLGRAAIRLLLVDPLLPEPLTNSAERNELSTTMERYNEVGKDIWRQLLGIHEAAA